MEKLRYSVKTKDGKIKSYVDKTGPIRNHINTQNERGGNSYDLPNMHKARWLAISSSGPLGTCPGGMYRRLSYGPPDTRGKPPMA